ncbi:MAG: polysulfide reductase NrfD [Candidatus Eremiobacteraeota bacterium]|nr:polysulfide reductase NrfD [Candidatus Eremiobacteraeota bacterium]
MENVQKHGAQYGAAGAYSPDAVAASMQRGDGGFGRDQQSYYDHPVLRKAHWKWEIVAYFFAGGAAAASSALAALAARGGDPDDAQLVRNGRYTALAGALVSSVLLVKDLGRPERFLNMLRIVKLKSPMSVGVYTLVTFSTNAGLRALDQLHADGVIRFDLRWAAKPLRALTGVPSTALMASYTGVLLSATAIPVWFTGRRHIPAIFVCSAASTGAALQNALLALTGGSARTAKKLELVELVASLAEAALLLHWERSAGDTAKPLFTGARGAKLKSYTLGAGIALPALLMLPSLLSRKRPAKQHRFRTLLAAACALYGGYVLRESVVYAGRDSADDPRAYLRHPE